jgi:hypothetical protein
MESRVLIFVTVMHTTMRLHEVQGQDLRFRLMKPYGAGYPGRSPIILASTSPALQLIRHVSGDVLLLQKTFPVDWLPTEFLRAR